MRVPYQNYIRMITTPKERVKQAIKNWKQTLGLQSRVLYISVGKWKSDSSERFQFLTRVCSGLSPSVILFNSWIDESLANCNKIVFQSHLDRDRCIKIGSSENCGNYVTKSTFDKEWQREGYFTFAKLTVCYLFLEFQVFILHLPGLIRQPILLYESVIVTD